MAQTLGTFSAGRYISDVLLAGVMSPLVRVARLGLGGFVRGRVYVHFDEAADAEDRLRACGFATASVRPAARLAELPPDSRASMAHILEASTT